MEWLAGFAWNGWQPCHGISGRLRLEYAFWIGFRVLILADRSFILAYTSTCFLIRTVPACLTAAVKWFTWTMAGDTLDYVMAPVGGEIG